MIHNQTGAKFTICDDLDARPGCDSVNTHAQNQARSFCPAFFGHCSYGSRMHVLNNTYSAANGGYDAAHKHQHNASCFHKNALTSHAAHSCSCTFMQMTPDPKSMATIPGYEMECQGVMVGSLSLAFGHASIIHCMFGGLLTVAPI